MNIKGISFFALALSALIAHGGTLPIGYTELEYIESTGKQYFDTLLPSIDDFRVEVDLELTNHGAAKSGQHSTLLGSCKKEVGVGREAVRPLRWNMFPWMVASIGDSMAHADQCPIRCGRFNFEITVGPKGYMTVPWLGMTDYFKVNGKAIRGRSWLRGNLGVIPAGGYPRHLYMFACNLNGSPRFHCFARVWSLKLWGTNKKNPTLLFDVIPCKNRAGQIGMYDRVSRKFFASASNTPFVAGPVARPGWKRDLIPNAPVKTAAKSTAKKSSSKRK